MFIQEFAVELDRRSGGATRGLVRVSRPIALLLHVRIEPVDVDVASGLGCDLARQVHREAERVVQEERAFTGDVSRREELREHVFTALQRAEESFLFPLHDGADQVVMGVEFRVRTSHGFDGGVHECGRDELARTQSIRVTHGAPDDASQHVPARFVTRHHAVGNQERHGARVLGEDP